MALADQWLPLRRPRTPWALHRAVWCCLGTLALLGSPAHAQTPGATAALQAVAPLDVPRYLGRWYEIAKFPNFFQRQCISDTSAEYSLLPEGGLRVQNQCRLVNGSMQQAIGVARQVGVGGAAQLKVRFAPAWLAMLPFVWGDYWVVDLDEAYTLAAVSEPKRQYLWILSRTPTLEGARYQALLQRLAAMGLDVSQLELTNQHVQ